MINNIAPNPYFEWKLDDDSNALHWIQNDNVTRTDNKYKEYGYSLVQNNIISNYDRIFINKYNSSCVIPNENYKFGAYYYLVDNNEDTPSDFNVVFRIKWLDFNLEEVSYDDIFFEGLSSFEEWEKLETDNINSPSNCHYVQFGIESKYTGSETTDIYWDSIFISAPMPTGIVWPEQLPESPNQDGFSEQMEKQVIRTKMEAGRPKVRKRYDAATRHYDVNWLLTRSQLDIFEDFFYNDLNGGANKFLMKDMRSEELVEYRFKIPPRPNLINVGGDAWEVQAELERLP